MIVLSTNQIIQMHSRLIETSGGSEGIRDYGLLDSAVHAPFQTYEGVSFYPSLISKGVSTGEIEFESFLVWIESHVK